MFIQLIIFTRLLIAEPAQSELTVGDRCREQRHCAQQETYRIVFIGLYLTEQPNIIPVQSAAIGFGNPAPVFLHIWRLDLVDRIGCIDRKLQIKRAIMPCGPGD
jgi:hypothetical protein